MSKVQENQRSSLSLMFSVLSLSFCVRSTGDQGAIHCHGFRLVRETTISLAEMGWRSGMDSQLPRCQIFARCTDGSSGRISAELP